MVKNATDVAFSLVGNE